MNRSGFCRGTAMGSFVFLKACPFGNIFGPAAPESSKKPSQNDGSALIRIMLLDALVGGRLNFSRHGLSLAVGWHRTDMVKWPKFLGLALLSGGALMIGPGPEVLAATSAALDILSSDRAGKPPTPWIS